MAEPGATEVLRKTDAEEPLGAELRQDVARELLALFVHLDAGRQLLVQEGPDALLEPPLLVAEADVHSLSPCAEFSTVRSFEYSTVV